MGEVGGSCRFPRIGPGWRAAVLGAVLLLAACSGGDEVARVRAWIDAGAETAERHDLVGLMARTSPEFRARPGNRDRSATAEALGAAFLHYRRFRLLYPRPAVTLGAANGTATASLPLLVVRAERTYPGLEELAADPAAWLAKVGENADLYHLELELVQRDGEWRAAAATLRGAGGLFPGSR